MLNMERFFFLGTGCDVYMMLKVKFTYDKIFSTGLMAKYNIKIFPQTNARKCS